MNDADNPYAAPQAPPEKKPPVPWSVYLRAGVAGITAFIIAFALTAGFLTYGFVVAADGYPPIGEHEEIARHGALACCVLIGALSGALAARREVRLRTCASA